MTGIGRELMATNGCFRDAEPERSRSERRAALETLKVCFGSKAACQLSVICDPNGF